MNIVLHQPEIPHNTGAIGRTCLMTGTGLHLIKPYGFYLDEKALKRAGLDYWCKVGVREYSCFDEFLEMNPGANFYLVETRSRRRYTDVDYKMGDFIVLGSETAGLPDSLLERYPDRVVTIPMTGEERSINLSVAAGIVLYEALRQNGFTGLV